MENNCTFWPERVLGVDISFACKYHDWHYKRQKVSRLTADLNLYRRVRDEARAKYQLFLGVHIWEGDYYLKYENWIGFKGKWRAKLIASVMFVGVRLFGWYAWRKNRK